MVLTALRQAKGLRARANSSKLQPFRLAGWGHDGETRPVRRRRAREVAQRLGHARVDDLDKLSDLLTLSPHRRRDCRASPAVSRRAGQAAGAQYRPAAVGLLLPRADPVRDPARLRTDAGAAARTNGSGLY